MSLKVRLFYIFSTLLGAAATYIIWTFWHEAVGITLVRGIQNANIVIIWMLVALLFQVVLLGLEGILFVNEKKLFFVYGIWSLPILLGNSPVLSRVMWFILLWVMCILASRLISQHALLLVKPVLPKILSTSFRLWLIGFSVILAGSLIFNPALQLQEFDISIPDSLWQQVWGRVTSFLGEEVGGSVEGESSFDPALLKQIQQALLESGVEIPIGEDGQPAFRSPEELEAVLASPQVQEALARNGVPQEAVQQVVEEFTQLQGGNFSDQARNQVENILNEAVKPLRTYIPYVIALSVFVTAQLITPFLGLFAIILIKVVLLVLQKSTVITINQENVMVRRYVLE